MERNVNVKECVKKKDYCARKFVVDMKKQLVNVKLRGASVVRHIALKGKKRSCEWKEKKLNVKKRSW
ncbi:hypothetical protein NQ314_020643 [Rhamnusium bicolor]|uniref:Uncharacterized protein n=1 Tax=Rhamnusium bicolor TaxID=1586634 RepID=A0AAV8WKH0_9CUCU|nr:hypothetical protein NQ314_020643 [Rhamnusium bicolor]